MKISDKSIVLIVLAILGVYLFFFCSCSIKVDKNPTKLDINNGTPTINIGGNNNKISNEDLSKEEFVIVRGVGLNEGVYNKKNLISHIKNVGLKKSPLHNKKLLKFIEKPYRPDYFIVVSDQFMHKNIKNWQRKISDYRRLNDPIGYHSFALKNAIRKTDLTDFIYVHLGSGCSVTRVIDGVSVCTSMGCEANSGMFMEARDGDVPSGYKKCNKEGLQSLAYNDFRELFMCNDKLSCEIKKLFVANIVRTIGAIENSGNLEYFFANKEIPKEKCPIVVGGGVAKNNELIFTLKRFFSDREVIQFLDLDEDYEMRERARLVI